MKSLTTVGFVLLAIASILFYLTTDFLIDKFTLSHVMGILGGIGIGLIIGGMVGYMSKGSAMKEDQRRKELLQLKKEKAELEKQTADLERQQSEIPPDSGRFY
ncbi:lipopolysaccharide assembly protein LapA domain-containing protein [Chryseobacterium sp.]|uniref:lipopolysaccharide assembly protein LapA domain-containing protein n=1 Tax=Chryseobacterium sp. TaxID=1871047 RepID=UPI0011CB8797|nr:lipopolysaccharide assembly protein LapA domain-containing protein [Chryseobacterium sp.]TXF75864.1 DUF1049 domain-containing protein [Chryseobacterium sp.]